MLTFAMSTQDKTDAEQSSPNELSSCMEIHQEQLDASEPLDQTNEPIYRESKESDNDNQSVASESSATGGPDSCSGDSVASLEETEGEILHDERKRGMIIKSGNSIAFVSDNLNEQIKISNSTDQSFASRSSRRSSMTSEPGSMISDLSPAHYRTLDEMEQQAKLLAHSVDKMLSDVQSSLHKMSAVTVGCMQTYRGCVEKTLNEVDSNIRQMYAFIAKCEQLNTDMKELYPIAEQINDIKRILDMFETDLQLTSTED